MVQIGDPALEFSLPDQTGTIRTNEEFKSLRYVIYFYPKDDTPGCTTEACAIRDNYSRFKELNVPVIGVSSDSVTSHKRFAEKYHLPFVLLSDKDHVLVSGYGANGITFPKRVTFVVGTNGKITKVYPKVTPATHATELLSDLVAPKSEE